MSTFETALRGGAVALLVLLALSALRDCGRSPAARCGALLAASGAAYAVASAPDEALQSAPWVIPLRLLSIGTPAVFWVAAVAYFDDDFKPSLYWPLAWLGLVIVALWQVLGRQPVAYFLYHGLALMFIVFAAWQAFIGRDADLVERRRRFRVVLVISTAFYTAVIIVSQWLQPGSGAAAPFSFINAVGLLGLTFAFAAARLSIVPEEQFTASGIPARSESLPREVRQDDSAVVVTANEQDTALLKALHDLMRNEKIYREEGLSIAALSARLSLPEYRLRRLINQKLGHRNFSAFVNSYRLSEAMAALTDPSQSSVPILTIALDTGFGSIGPFNRAFKTHTGMTPTEYRRERLNGMPSAPTDPLPIPKSASFSKN